jgi:hypothetical protein
MGREGLDPGAHAVECSQYSGFQQAIALAIHAVNSEIRLIPFNLAAGGNCFQRRLCVSLHAKRPTRAVVLSSGPRRRLRAGVPEAAALARVGIVPAETRLGWRRSPGRGRSRANETDCRARRYGAARPPVIPGRTSPTGVTGTIARITRAINWMVAGAIARTIAGAVGMNAAGRSLLLPAAAPTRELRPSPRP